MTTSYPSIATRQRFDLFLASVLVLFLELACIRWLPANVIFLTFFTNTVLLASFLGMSVGCLAAGRRRNWIVATPVLLVLTFVAAQLVEWARQHGDVAMAVGARTPSQVVFFGAEPHWTDPSTFVVPIDLVCAFFFVMVTLTMIGPGQELGRALARVSNRLEAYTINIFGSLAGIAMFSACSWFHLPPAWWFAVILAALAYFLLPDAPVRAAVLMVAPVLVLLVVSSPTPFSWLTSPSRNEQQQYWSPYYRIDYEPNEKLVAVNLIGHQQMSARGTFPAYALPHALNRDVGRAPFGDVLIIGAGTGNDISRALAWGAAHVDAVEIDPVIYRLGVAHHPDQPYADKRVFVHLDDGRNYLRSSDRQYDLIVYALVDSLVLHSSYSNIRLESYLFTRQAFDDVRKRLKPGGLFVMYNYFRQGWIVSRLVRSLSEAFGAGNPLTLNLPGRKVLGPNDVLVYDFTVMFAGATGPLRAAFANAGEFWLNPNAALEPASPNGFAVPSPAERAVLVAGAKGKNPPGWMRLPSTLVLPASKSSPIATDDWPFLYLARPMIPWLNVRGMGIMAALAFLFIAPFVRRGRSDAGTPARADGAGLLAQMFFLGAGFMLLETKAVVHMALLFGSTWTVNSIVFFAVLVTILLANLFVLVAKPERPRPFYVGLFVALAANACVPLDAFLGMNRGVQVIASCGLAFAPVLFAGVLFAMAFSRAATPDRAFGANTAGAMFGGLAEYSSMLLGFQFIVLVAFVFYSLSAWAASRRAVRPLPAPAVQV